MLATHNGVTVKSFAKALEAAAEETGQDAQIMMGVMVGALMASLPEAERANLAEPAAKTGSPQDIEDMIRIGSALERSLNDFLAYLREMRQTEVTASELRKNWAEYLALVRAKEQTVYITLHGKRVAALTPAYVAEQYAQGQEWYWDPEWQAGEAEADADKAAGRFTRYESDAEFLASFDEDE